MKKNKKPKVFKKSIFLIIDAMRYDTINNNNLYPTLSGLAENGIFKKLLLMHVLLSLFYLHCSPYLPIRQWRIQLWNKRQKIPT